LVFAGREFRKFRQIYILLQPIISNMLLHRSLTALLLPFLLVLPGTPHAGNPGKPFRESHFATIDSVTIHYRLWPARGLHHRGKVLLIHGFCGSTFCWRYNWDTLAASGYTVVAVDLPGFGYSERSDSLNQSQSNRGRQLWKLLGNIDGADTTPWNIVGHSMGGGAAEAAALMNLHRTKSLTILDGMIFITNDDLNRPFVGVVNHPVYKKMLVAYYKHYYLTYNNFRHELKSTYGFLPDTATTNGYWKTLQIEGTAETVVNLLANSREIIKLDAHDLKETPVLIIWGKNDKTIGLSTGKKLKGEVPSAELRVIPGARHMAMETHPFQFNAILLEFLNRHN